MASRPPRPSGGLALNRVDSLAPPEPPTPTGARGSRADSLTASPSPARPAVPGGGSPRSIGVGGGARQRIDSSAAPCHRPGLSGMRLIAGTACPALAEEVAARIGVPLSAARIKRFNDGEVAIQLSESVRGCKVFIVQSIAPPVNDSLMELLLLISAARRASAASVTAVVPYYAYGRHSHRADADSPLASADVALLIEEMGAARVLSVDLHCPQIQGFFSPRCPVDNLYASPTACAYFLSKKLVDPVVVSPDAAGVPRAKAFAEGFGRVSESNEPQLAVAVKVEGVVTLVGDVEDRDVVIVDDMLDSGKTLTTAADVLRANGARRVFAFVTHGLFSGDALARVDASALDEVLVGNTIPLPAEYKEITRKVRILSVGKLVETAIRAIHGGSSVSSLFDSDLAGARV